MTRILRTYLPREIASSKRQVVGWPKHEWQVVALLTSVLLVSVFVLTFSHQTSTGDLIVVILVLTKAAMSFRVIAAGAGIFQHQRLSRGADLSNQSKLNRRQTLLVKWVAALQRSWSWALLYSFPLLAWGVLINVIPSNPLNTYYSNTIVFVSTCGIALLLTALELVLSTGIGIMAGALVSRNTLATLVVFSIRLIIPLIVFFIIYQPSLENPSRAQDIVSANLDHVLFFASAADSSTFSILHLMIPRGQGGDWPAATRHTRNAVGQ